MALFIIEWYIVIAIILGVLFGIYAHKKENKYEQ